MVADSSLLTNPSFIFWGAFILVAIAIAILIILERKLIKRLQIKKQEEYFYTLKIAHVKSYQKDPHKFLIEISNLAREFFKKEFHLGSELRFAELIDIFRKRKREDIANFCESLQKALYEGNELEKQFLESLLLNELISLIKKQRNINSLAEKNKGKVKEKKETQNKFIFTIKNFVKKEKEATNLIEKESKKIKDFIEPYQSQAESKIESLKPAISKIEKSILPTKSTSKSLSSKPKTLHKTHSLLKKGVKSKQENPNVDPYRFVKSIDNLDRVKEKLIKARKPMEF